MTVLDIIISFLSGLISGSIACLIFEFVKAIYYNDKTKKLRDSLKRDIEEFLDAFDQIFLDSETREYKHLSLDQFKESYYKRNNFRYTYLAFMSEAQSVYNKAKDIIANPYITPEHQLKIQEYVVKACNNIDYVLKLFCSDSNKAKLANGSIITLTIKHDNIDIYDQLKLHVDLLKNYTNQ